MAWIKLGESDSKKGANNILSLLGVYPKERKIEKRASARGKAKWVMYRWR